MKVKSIVKSCQYWKTVIMIHNTTDFGKWAWGPILIDNEGKYHGRKQSIEQQSKTKHWDDEMLQKIMKDGVFS